MVKCPACGSTAIKINEFGSEKCMRCGFQRISNEEFKSGKVYKD